MRVARRYWLVLETQQMTVKGEFMFIGTLASGLEPRSRPTGIAGNNNAIRSDVDMGAGVTSKSSMGCLLLTAFPVLSASHLMVCDFQQQGPCTAEVRPRLRLCSHLLVLRGKPQWQHLQRHPSALLRQFVGHAWAQIPALPPRRWATASLNVVPIFISLDGGQFLSTDLPELTLSLSIFCSFSRSTKSLSFDFVLRAGFSCILSGLLAFLFQTPNCTFRASLSSLLCKLVLSTMDLGQSLCSSFWALAWSSSSCFSIVPRATSAASRR